MKVAVMGWGVFGRAIGSLLTENNVAFSAVDIAMPLTHDIDVLFQMVPTQFIRDAFQTNAQFMTPNTLIVNGAKGIEKETHQLPFQIIEELGQYEHYFSLIGPSFASGIVDKDPTLVSLGYSSRKHLKIVRDLLQTSYFRVQSTADYKTLELTGALKNVYAIVCGYAEGLGFGINTRAKLITLGLQEVVKLGQAMGATKLDVLVPGVVGDLVLTCSTPESRNYQFGLHLASMNQVDALKQVKTTVEGLSTSHSIQALAREYQVKLPVAKLTHRLIEGGVDAKHYFHEFVEAQ